MYRSGAELQKATHAMIRLRGAVLACGLLAMGATLSLTACSTNAATPMASAMIPTVAGTWRGHQDPGHFRGLRGTDYMCVEQTADESLS